MQNIPVNTTNTLRDKLTASIHTESIATLHTPPPTLHFPPLPHPASGYDDNNDNINNINNVLWRGKNEMYYVCEFFI